MIPQHVTQAVQKAFYSLQARAKIRRPHQALARLRGLTTNQPVSEVRPMADANSIHAPVASSKNGTPLYECVCPDCGLIRLQDKRKIGTRCHPCAGKARATHGMCGTPLFKLLMNVRVRCEQPSASNYEYYGGRGIFVCQEWVEDPRAFAEWATKNGYAKGLELDRIDVDGPYAPWNCRFVDHKTNSRTRRNAKCDLEKAKSIKDMLAAGVGYRQAAASVGVPPMVAWHIAKGNTWRDA